MVERIFALILVGGGLIGYLKAGSAPSLIMGAFGGLFFVICKNQGLLRLGLALFTLFFLWRWALSGNFMPAGLMTFLSFSLFTWRIRDYLEIRKDDKTGTSD